MGSRYPTGFCNEIQDVKVENSGEEIWGRMTVSLGKGVAWEKKCETASKLTGTPKGCSLYNSEFCRWE